MAAAFVLLATVAWLFMVPSSNQASDVFYGNISHHDQGAVTPVPSEYRTLVASSKVQDGGAAIDMTYTISNFDPESGIVNGFLSFTPPPQDLNVPKPLFLNGTQVKIEPSSPFQGRTGVPYQLVATGTAATFPSDAYLIELTPQLAYVPSSGPNENNEIVVPNRSLYVMTGPRLNSYVVKALKSGDTGNLKLLITRRAHVKIWYYVIAGAPAILILALMLQLASGATRITLEAGIGIIAILPLRQVIVPPDIETITRIDLLLGFEVIAMILLVAYAAFRASCEE